MSSKFFDRVARRYDRTFAPDARATEEDVRALAVGLPRNATALDLGSGTGRAWRSLLDAGLRVIALDASLEMFREASRRSSSEHVLRVRADLYAPWPIADRSIDLVIALHAVLAHPPGDPFEAWRSVGREIARVSREGARIAIDMPDPEWARRNLRPLDGDRFLHREQDGVEIVAIVPDPKRVVEALGLPLVLVPCPTGIRARSSPT